MNAQQQRVLESFRRVQGWFEASREYLSATGTGSINALTANVEQLTNVVERATAHSAAQQTNAAQAMLVSKDEREQRRSVLTHHMVPIARVARMLRGEVPGIGVLTMPKGNIESPALITAAAVMARKAEVYASVLAENGLPTDFVAQLDAAAARLKKSLDDRGLARGARAASTRGLESELAVGRRIVGIMDVHLTRAFRYQPARMAEWKHVIRVTQRGSNGRSGASAAKTGPTLVQLSPTGAEVLPTVSEQPPTDVVESPEAEERAA